mmetsp:Transcript_15187/g.37831  ORF Transcript_15187/g.37831 Transcript_15187/m.37831 type:complete len:484 (-) Transcript_15187:508-1959(-)
MVIMLPTRGKRKPAPTDARTSLMGRVKPEGAPLALGSWLNEYCVLAMQMGRLWKPMRVYFSIWASACSVYSTPAAWYISLAIISILALMGRLTSYRNLNAGGTAGEWHASTTACARSAAPAPPRPWWLQMTAALAPASCAAFFTASSSAGVSAANWLMATTTGTPYLRALSMWRARLQQPAVTRPTSSVVYAWGSGVPATTGGPPPCIFSARTVATSTTQSGARPDARHLMFMNFSMPMSAPKPASVTTYPSSPTSLSPIWSATMELLPCAMLAKGPACTSTGVFSSVCISVGSIVSFISTVSAPPTPRSSAVTGSPALELPMTMRPRRSRMSARSLDSASTAMISDDTVMSNPVARVWSRSSAPCPVVMPRRKRSLVSTTRRQVMDAGSMSRRAKRRTSSGVSSAGSVLVMPSLARRRSMTGANVRRPCLSAGHRRLNSASSLCAFSWNMRTSMAAASRLLAAVMAWMSPVRCRFSSSMGMT